MNDYMQLINTACVKTMEDKVKDDIEGRLKKLSSSLAMKGIQAAIDHISIDGGITKDQAAVEIIRAVRELDKTWTDYLLMDGLEHLKKGMIFGENKI